MKLYISDYLEENESTQLIVKRFVFLIARYFIGIPSMRPGQRHLYRVSSTLPRTGTPLHPAVCLTCTISSGMTNDEESGHRISFASRQDDLINRNEWHDHDETQTDSTDDKEHHLAKDSSRKDKSKSKNISSEFQLSSTIFSLISSYSIGQFIIIALRQRSAVLCNVIANILRVKYLSRAKF